MNIESSRGSFSQHMCNVFQLLRDRLGPALITTITPYTQTASMYAQLATACPDLVTWVNWEGYIHRGSSTMRYSQWNEYAAMASHFGYEKMAFGIMSASGGSSPSGPYSNPSLPQMDQIIKQAEAVSQGAGPRCTFTARLPLLQTNDEQPMGLLLYLTLWFFSQGCFLLDG